MNSASPLQFQINRRTIVANIATLFSGSAIAQFVNAITFILIARQLGPDSYGQYTGSIVFATFCSIVFSLGLNLWLLQEGGRNPNRIGELTGSILTIRVAIGVLWLLVMFFIADIIDSSTFSAEYIRLASVVIWINSLFTSILTGFKSILKNVVSSVLDIAAGVGLFGITLTLVAIGVDEVSRFLQARAIIYLISLLAGIVLARRILQLKASKRTIKVALKESPPFASSEFLSWTYMRADVLVIAFALDELAVGLYAPAEGIINALYLVPLAINFVSIPVLSNLFSTDVKQAWQTAKRLLAVLSLAGIAMFVGLFIGSKYLVMLLGTEYTGSLEVLRIMSIILFFHSISFGAASILVATQQQTNRTIVQVIVVIINIGLNFLVVKQYGITGVAWVYVISEFVLFLGYSYLVLRYRSKTSRFSSQTQDETVIR